MKTTAKRVAVLGLFTCLALILSFLETLLPPLTAIAPGVKIGLPNVIIIFLLIRLDFKSAAAVSIVRIMLASLLFGTAVSFVYSLAGAVLSLIIMYLLKKSDLFSLPVISIVGALSHNAAQIGVAALLMHTKELFYYLPVLCLSALISGVLVGLTALLLIKALKKVNL